MLYQKTIKLLLIYLILFLTVRTQDSFASFKQSMETHVTDIANKMKNIYGELCGSSAAKTCDVKSFNRC